MNPATFIVDSEARRERCAKRIQALPLEGEIWDVSIKAWKPNRSLEANRRLWALHQLAAQATGHAVDELHEMMKWRFLPHVMVKIGEHAQEVPGRSSKLTTKEFREFMEAVESFYIAELGVILGDFS